MSPEAIRKVIETRFDTLSPELQRAARWVTRHGTAVALHSMRDSARAAGVTPATMTRLAQRLGFEGFEGLRAPYRRQLAGASSGAEIDAVDARRDGPGSQEMFGPLNLLQQSNVASVAQLNDSGGIDRAARTVVEATQVYFLGMRACHGIAFYLAYAYGLIRANGSLITGDGGTLSDQLVRIGEGGVLVAVSQGPYSRQTVEGVMLARDHGAAVIALTDSPLSPLARGAQQVLLYDTASNAYFHSTVGAQALAEALTVAVAGRGGEPARLHLRRMRTHLRNSRAYWERPHDKE